MHQLDHIYFRSDFFSFGYLFIFFITFQIFSYQHIILRFWHSDDQYLYHPNFSRGNVGALWVSQAALVVKQRPPKAGHIRDEGSISESGRSSGGGHGNPLQYSCLENPMVRGTWRAIVHRVVKSWAWLKWLSTTQRRCSLILSPLWQTSPIPQWPLLCPQPVTISTESNHYPDF